MIIIAEARIEEQIAEVKFACDLLQCKGACCTIPGGRGAPLTEDEVLELEKAYPAAGKYIPVEHQEVIQRHGMYEGEPGFRATTCINERACVFVFYENEIARCSLERAYMNGETTWRKPISCHLFPIRVSPAPRTVLRYEKIDPCKAAIERGEKENIVLSDFLQEPLVRRFGEPWYHEFKEICTEINTKR